MKRAVTLSLALAIALPLVAEEPKKTAEKTAQTAPAQSAPEQIVPAEPVTAQDSPMVAAAKRANSRRRKGAIVITNDSVKNAKGGHITTTTNQRTVDVPAPQLTESELAAKKAADKAAEEKKVREIGAEKDKKAAEARERKAAAKANAVDEGHDGMPEDAGEFTGGPAPEAPPPPRR
jgi:hypothetical protein